MSVYIEITNDELKLLEIAKIKKIITIKKADRTALAYNNSSLDDMYQAIKDLNYKLKKVTFIENTSNVLYYDMKIPNVSAIKAQLICKNELVNKLSKQEELLVDYFNIKKESDSENRVLVTGLALLRVTELMRVSKKLRVKPEIKVAYEGIFNYLQNMKLFVEGTSILAIEVNANLMKIWLFENDEYVTLRINRIKSESYDVMLDEINDEVSKIIQFNTTRSLANKITNAYIFGDNEQLTNLVKDLNLDFVDLDVKMLPINQNISVPADFNFLANIYSLGMMMGDK